MKSSPRPLPLTLSQVAQFVASAENQLKAGDYAAAVRTADAGMRLDAGNKDLQAVMDRAKPKFEASERTRRLGLSSTELLKEKGDDFYKKAAFEVCMCCVCLSAVCNDVLVSYRHKMTRDGQASQYIHVFFFAIAAI